MLLFLGKWDSAQFDIQVGGQSLAQQPSVHASPLVSKNVVAQEAADPVSVLSRNSKPDQHLSNVPNSLRSFMVFVAFPNQA